MSICVCTFMGISSIHVKQTISYRIASMTSRYSKGPSDVTAGQSLFAFLFLVAVSALAWLPAVIPQLANTGQSSIIASTHHYIFLVWPISTAFPHLWATVHAPGDTICLPSEVLGDKESSLGWFYWGSCPLRHNKTLSQCPLSSLSPFNLAG